MGLSQLLSSAYSLMISPVDILWAEMEKPGMYGIFHIISLLLVIGVCVFAVIMREKITKATVTRTLLAVWIIAVVFEIIKQINFSYSPDTGEWSYQWYAFPFQFCSSMMYVLPFAVFIRNERVRDFAYSFLMSYNIFAGLAVMLYPATVFVEDICINVQTMVHHGSMLIIGVLLYAVKAVKIDYKLILKATAVFAMLVAAALILNGIFADKDGFNMFYVDTEGCELPILGMLFGKVPQPVFVLIYIVGFAACATLIMLLMTLIFKLVNLKVAKRNA